MSERNYDEVPFSAIVPGAGVNAMLRVARSQANGSRRISARDIIKAVSEKINGCASDPWLGVSIDTQAELLPHTSEFKFTGGEQKMEPVLTLEGCFILLMKLSGTNALLFRLRTARILLRFFAGDETLITKACVGADEKEDSMATSAARETRSRRASTRQRHAPY